MQFASLLIAAAAFAVAQAAKFGNPPQSFVGVTAGSNFNISWYDASGPVTILLKNGDATALKTVSTITSGQTGTSYIWSIPATLPVNTYALEIDDNSGTPNYSVQFVISGGPTASSSVASSTTSGSSSSTSSGSSASTTSATTVASGNSTSSTTTGSKTSTATTTKTSSTSTSTSTTTSSVNSAAGVASPIAFIFLAFAAILTLN